MSPNSEAFGQEVVGIPIQTDGWRLSAVDLERGERLTARYVDEAAGWVSVVLLPRTSTDRLLDRLAHCAVYYEGELERRGAEERARAASLVAEVSHRVEARLAAAAARGAAGFPFGLGYRADVPQRIRFDVAGVLSLLPELALGQEVALGWRLSDAYAGPGAAEVSLELGRDDAPERLVLTLRRASDPRLALARLEHFTITETLLGPHARVEPRATSGELRAAASLVVLLLRLRDRPGLAIEPALPSRRAAEPRAADRSLASSRDPEHGRELALLAPVLGAAARYFGASPCIRRIDDAAIEAYQLTFPPIPAELGTGPTFFLQTPPGFSQRRAMRDYFESLGYRVHADGLMRTVPTPESLKRLLARAGVVECGFDPWLYTTFRWRVPLDLWLELYTSGTIGINVSGRGFYRAYAPLLALRTPNRFWCEHLTAVGHDMSVHVLATHRVPRARLLELGRRVAEVVEECRWLRRQDALGPVIEIYEADLVRHCQEIWESLGRPEDFADAFADAANTRPFEEVVARRLDEARARLARPRPALAPRALAGARGLAAALTGRLRGSES